MSVETSGLDQTLAMLEKVSDTKNFLPECLYQGAGVVAKEMKAQLSALQTDTKPKGPVRNVYPYEKEVLISNFGIAPFSDSNDVLNTKIGFDGYYTNKKGEQRPVPLLANSVNAGTSFLRKQAFKDRAYRNSKESSVEAMQKSLDQSMAKLTK